MTCHVMELNADQHGSRFSQQKFEIAPLDEEELFFQELLPKALMFMIDFFGNYLTQNFFKHGIPQ